jgi:hypothetical protein
LLVLTGPTEERSWLSNFQASQPVFAQWLIPIAQEALILDRIEAVEDNCCFCVEISIQHWYVRVGW